MSELKHYSQMSQDLFADYLLDSSEGYFVDVGCYDPRFINNTYRLEKKGFKGLLLDYHNQWIDLAKEHRASTTIAQNVDLLRANFTEVLRNNNCPSVIDYIDLDVDEATLKVLNDVEHDSFSFKVLTVEHDYYAGDQNGAERRKRSREILTTNGYELVCADVANNSGPQEDWYVNPEFISESKWKPLVCSDVSHLEVRKLMDIEDTRLNWGPLEYDKWHKDEPRFS